MLLDHPLRANARVLVEDAVLRHIEGYRQRLGSSTEAGGILMGYRRADHLHIVMATKPGPNDRRQRHSFVRLDSTHQAQALTGWRRSGGRMDYLGDWHTHAEANPSPSTIDVAEWEKICRLTGQPLVFFIMGTVGYWLGVGEGTHLARARETLSEAT
jgi:integrative and conjugative element protein (TIGR02256 family)